jgi:hypothetical protein
VRKTERAHALSTLMAAVRWTLFAWGTVCVAITSLYLLRWAMAADDPLRGELILGASLGMVYGGGAWLALPLLVLIAWREQPSRVLLLQLAPAIAGHLLVGAAWLSA